MAPGLGLPGFRNCPFPPPEAGRAPWASHRPLLTMGPPGAGGGALRVPVEAHGVCGVVRLSPPVYCAYASQRAALAERIW